MELEVGDLLSDPSALASGARGAEQQAGDEPEGLGSHGGTPVGAGVGASLPATAVS